MNKLFKNISEIRDFLTSSDYKTGRMGQSYKYFGFPIEFGNFSCWFGYFLPLGEQHKTPVFIQIRKDWIKGNPDFYLKNLPLLGFENDPSEEWIRPFKIDSIDNWKNDLKQLLTELESNFNR